MKGYYRDRAPVYDRVYRYPERKADLAYLERHVPTLLARRDVIEVAAGTGYWTQFLCREARSVLATDATVEALAQIRQRGVADTVSIRVVDAYSLDDLEETFSGAFAGLWLSHVPIERRRDWLASLHRRLESRSIVVFLDNSPTQCKRLPITHTDRVGNTYQDRVTDSGARYRVLKNFPTETELLEATAHLGRDHRYEALEHFWLFHYVAV